MSGTERIVRFARTLVWSRLRAHGLRQFALPFGLGVLFLGTIVVASRRPGILTLTSEEAIRGLVTRYFTDISGDAFVVGLLLIQGPYLLSLFSTIIGLRVGEKMVESEIASGRVEQYLNLPYRTSEIFQSFILGALTITLLQFLVIAVISVGGLLSILVLEDLAFQTSIRVPLLVSFLTPVPMALWATLVVIAIGLWSGSDTGTGGISDLLEVLAILPAFSGVATVSLFPGVNLVLVTGAMITFAVLGVGAVSAAMGYWFRPETVLRTA